MLKLLIACLILGVVYLGAKMLCNFISWMFGWDR